MPHPGRSATLLLTEPVRHFWRWSPDELNGLLAPAGRAASVELKVVVPQAAHAFTCAAFGVDLDRADARRVYFLDTPDGQLQRRGIVARIRSIDNRRDDSVIKLRRARFDVSPGHEARAKRRAVEVDAMPGRLVCTTAIRKHLGRHDVQRAIAEGRPPHTLFSRTQRELFASYVPARIRLDDLVTYGPVEVRRIGVVPDGLDRRLTVERWTFPDGSRLLEVSTSCTTGEAVEVAARTASVLRAHCVDPTRPQHTKTRVTLAYFRRSAGEGRTCG